jgi:hypothetical protein
MASTVPAIAGPRPLDAPAGMLGAQPEQAPRLALQVIDGDDPPDVAP